MGKVSARPEFAAVGCKFSILSALLTNKALKRNANMIRFVLIV